MRITLIEAGTHENENELVWRNFDVSVITHREAHTASLKRGSEKDDIA